MRFTLFIALCLSSAWVQADTATDFLDFLCVGGFEKQTKMPKAEIQRFCGCMRSDISPSLSSAQRSVLASAQADLTQGRRPNTERFAASGVRDLLIAAQARCEAAFYPPSGPITVVSGNLYLTLRCESDTGAPEALIYIKNDALFSQMEIRAAIKRMTEGIFDSEFAQVSQKIDGLSRKTERWEIDITGHTVSPPRSADLIALLRTANNYEVVIQRGQQRHAGVFPLAGKIPPRWVPCGGVTR
jgi:hypothetical protein